MKRFVQFVAISTVGTALCAGGALAGNNPVDENWWPSEFGPDDEAGGTNYITPQKRIEAAKLVYEGDPPALPGWQ